jgi:RNA polymerase sigma factor for flagellar operon FliA
LHAIPANPHVADLPPYSSTCVGTEAFRIISTISAAPDDFRRYLTDNLPLLQQVVRRVARRHRLREGDAEELLGALQLKLVENNYEVLRRFQGRSSLATYFTSIATRHLLDERNSRWGKWRPSVYARGRGAIAVHLEKLLTRDGLSFHEAVRQLRTNMQVTETEEELYQLSLGFPRRAPRRFVEPDVLEQLPNGQTAEDNMERARRSKLAAAAAAALRDALEKLSPQDQLLLKMCYVKGLPLSEVARTLKLEQKPLYRRRDHVLAVLREQLQQRGISRADISDITAGDLDSPGGPGEI